MIAPVNVHKNARPTPRALDVAIATIKRTFGDLISVSVILAFFTCPPHQ